MREHLHLVYGRQSYRRGQRYKNGIIEAWQKEGVARAPVAYQTLFKSSSYRRYFPVLAPELESISVSEPILSKISHAPASTADGAGELGAGASSAYHPGPLNGHPHLMDHQNVNIPIQNPNFQLHRI
jgi:hypothetical protein